MTAVAIDRSLRAELQTFVEELLDSEDAMNVEKMVRLAHRHFDGDEWVREALIREGLTGLIPGIAASVRHTLRTRARENTDPLTRRERISSVFEHVGEGYSKSVFAMTRPDHLFVAEEREKAAAGFLRWAGFHRAIAALHKDNTTTTGELPEAKVAEIWRLHIEKNGD